MNNLKMTIASLAAIALMALAPIVTARAASTTVNAASVLNTYAKIAHATYTDSLVTAEALKQAVGALVAGPTAKNLETARAAWRAARVPYQQSEVYRFGNAIVDEWEGKVNAWPLDEGLIDYVDHGAYGTESDENRLYAANVIANPKFTLSGHTIDASRITKMLLSDTLHEIDGVEANVATGYHAIEFLLWGQDLNGTGPNAGNRPASDYDAASCTGGNCARRAAYLMTVTELLIDDLKDMVAAWAPGGTARKALAAKGPKGGLANIVIGMGSLSYGELAGERMKLGLMLHDPEEEHDCFSDNTHYSHYYDAMGIRNVYLGEYRRVDGRIVKGPSLSNLVAEYNAEADARLRALLDNTIETMTVIVQTAEAGQAYDQMIGSGNTAGNARVQAAIDALTAQTKGIEKAVVALKLGALNFEGSDSLDNPGKVFK